MRAGLAAWPQLVLELFSASQRYGFVLQPTGVRESCDRAPLTYQFSCGRLPFQGLAPRLSLS